MKDIATDLMEFDAGNLNARETLELFALLVASGLAWTLQGTYGRTARVLINEGWISPSAASPSTATRCWRQWREAASTAERPGR